jgi:hypothetical protein
MAVAESTVSKLTRKQKRVRRGPRPTVPFKTTPPNDSDLISQRFHLLPAAPPGDQGFNMGFLGEDTHSNHENALCSLVLLHTYPILLISLGPNV